MGGYVRKRPFMFSWYVATLRNVQSSHTSGGDLPLDTPDPTRQGTSLPTAAIFNHAQIVAEVTTAGTTGSPGPITDSLIFRTWRNIIAGNTMYAPGFITDTTGWKRDTDTGVASAGADDFPNGEDGSGTPDELLGELDCQRNAVSRDATGTVHGEYV